MKVVYKDLARFLDQKPTMHEISEKLFQLGHENSFSGDIFEVDLTPNRGDCLSVQGLARELSIFYGKGKMPIIYEEEIGELELDFDNLSPNDCPLITFMDIEVENSNPEYKDYLEDYFKNFKLNKTNFFADVSNFISYELGQPTHCYDSQKITSKLIFDKKDLNMSFKTLHGDEILLEGKNCIFSMNDSVIGLAGIMGGESTACTKSTKKALVECAFFNPESIIGKSLQYNLNSDAAHKFERGVDSSSQIYALRRFIKVISDHSKISSLKIKSFEYSKEKLKSLAIDEKRIEDILGIKLKKQKYIEYLKKLDFKVSDKIYIPTYRHDISSQNDIAEEIARVIGYDNIGNDPIRLQAKKSNSRDDLSYSIKSFLISHGFSEVINFPFVKDTSKTAIKIDNPLDSNKSYLRTNLKDSLIENLIFNERRQKDSIKLFEISDIYVKEKNSIKKIPRIGIIASGRVGNNFKDFSKKITHDYLSNIFKNNLNYEINFQEIGRDALNTKKKSKIFYSEISIDDSFKENFKNKEYKKEEIKFIRYEKVSEFPSSIRDFSFSIKDVEVVPKVIKHLGNLKEKNLKDSFMFDFYRNDSNDEVKIGYRFIFQSNEKTLQEEDINRSIKIILEPLLDLKSVSIPGM